MHNCCTEFVFVLSIRLALDKDPEYVRAVSVMGQTLLQKELPAEASEYLESAISKVCINVSF